MSKDDLKHRNAELCGAEIRLANLIFKKFYLFKLGELEEKPKYVWATLNSLSLLGILKAGASQTAIDGLNKLYYNRARGKSIWEPI